MTETTTSVRTRRRGAVALGGAAAIVGAGMLSVAFAGPAVAAEGDTFTYQVFASDLSDPENPIVNPPGYAWDIVASGPETYTNDELASAIFAEDVAGGTYTVTATPNAAAEAGSYFDEIWCQRWDSSIPSDDLDESDFETFTPPASGDAFAVAHVDGHSTVCAEIWTIGEDAPPADGQLFGTVGLRTSPNLIGDEDDVDLVLQSASGATVGSFRETGLVVPPGTYTPLVVASASAQPGFDPDAWQKSSWQCSSIQSGTLVVPYGDSLTVPEGATMQCHIEIAEHFGRVAIFPPGGDIDGDVSIGWGGVSGQAGTPYSFGFEVSLPEPPGGAPTPTSVIVTVHLADN
ncbi:MAG: hypothetical protein ACTH31_16700, partial [Pseudoclavibacter sp.]